MLNPPWMAKTEDGNMINVVQSRRFNNRDNARRIGIEQALIVINLPLFVGLECGFEATLICFFSSSSSAAFPFPRLTFLFSSLSLLCFSALKNFEVKDMVG